MNRCDVQTIAIASSGTVSGWVAPPKFFTFAMAYLPAMDNGAIGLEVTLDNGTTNAPILKADGSGDAVVCASGEDPCFIDISDYIRAIPGGDENIKFRFTCAAQTGGARSLRVFFKE